MRKLLVGKLLSRAVILLLVATSPLMALGRKTTAEPEMSATPAAQGTCEIHGLPLVEKTMKIAYGLPILSGDYEKARRALFPHPRDRPLGGCEVTEKSPLTRKILVCPKCDKIQTAWLKAHPGLQDARIETESEK